MEKIVALITIILCCFLLAACQGPQGEKGDKGDPGESGIISYDGTEGLDFYPLPDGTYGVKAGKTIYLEEIVVPAEYDGKKVTKILDGAFTGAPNLVSVSLPTTINSIENGAFSRCISLTNVIFDGESQLAFIGNGAFSGCTSLASIVIPDGVNAIGDSAFFACTSLKSVDIPASVIIIGNGAFQECVFLESVNLAENSQLLTIGSNAFFYCTSLKNIEIPTGITTINADAFYNCTSLTSIIYNGTNEQWNDFSLGLNWNWGVPACKVTCSDGYVSINDCVLVAGVCSMCGLEPVAGLYNKNNELLASWHELIDTYGLDITIEYYGSADFDNFCETTITSGYCVLNNNDNLSSGIKLFIDDNVTHISQGSFAYCSMLEYVSIPISVSTIGKAAFHSCSNLKSIVFEGTVEQWQAIDLGFIWNAYIPATYVQCSDGVVPLN